MDHDNDFYCGRCGAIFDPFESDDFDDVKCPECGSRDVAAMDDLDDDYD